MTTTATTLKFKNKVHAWEVVVTIERTPATVADLGESRWLSAVGADQIVSVERIAVSQSTVLYPSPSRPEGGFEVLFKCGARGFVNGHEFQELDALLVGTKGYLHGLAVWRKRGHIVGTPVPWFRAQRSVRTYQNPNRAPRCCAAELYARAAGQSWGLS
jgi:hypothetical protein